MNMALPIGKKCTAFGLILLILGIVYSNTFDASWHLDDYHNLIRNPWIHINNLYPESLKHSFFAAYDKGKYTGEHIFRPAVMLSFAVNWYFGKTHVAGYHLVNILIHITAALFLFLSIHALLGTPNVRQKFSDCRYEIALLSAVLWAIHPIQTQAVTYIVQRMASMAGMFFIMAIYAYLKGRLTTGFLKKAFFFLVSLLSFALAISSKQNTAMLPLVLVGIEFIFFRDLSRPETQKTAMIAIGLIVILLIVACTYLFLDNSLFHFLEKYSRRPFTVTQRLMTEPRVVLHYLYQLVYPVSSNYSVTYDTLVSTSLISPWTTLPAMMVIIGMLAGAFFCLCRIPVLSFSILFFFLNHLIESTIFPLELVFEHRNYIPSMFLFVPMATWLWRTLDRYRQSGKKLFFYFYALMIAVAVFATGMGTYTRNFDWLTEKSLWEDALSKAPGRARPHQNLAVTHYLRIGDDDTAAKLLKEAVGLKSSTPDSTLMVSFLNLSQIYTRQNDTKAALLYAKKAVDSFPADIAALNYVSVLIQSDQVGKAELYAKRFLKEDPSNEQGLRYLIIAQLKLRKYREAEASVLQLFKRAPFSTESLLYFGLAQSALKNYKKAGYYLEKVADKKSPEQLLANLALIGNSIEAGDEQKTNLYVKKLFDRFSIHDIKQELKAIQNEKYPLIKISAQGDGPRLKAYLKKMINKEWGVADETVERHHDKT